MKGGLKLVALRVTRIVMMLFRVFPVKRNRVFFANYSTSKYACNAKYITEYLLKTYPGEFDFIWMAEIPEKTRREKGIRVTRQNTLSYFFYLATSKVFVSNGGMPTYFPFRDNQLTIDTWHGGGAYKRTHAGIPSISAAETEHIKIAAKATKLFVSSSEMFTEEVIRKSFLYEGEVLRCGMPRNDILMEPCPEIAGAVKRYYDIPPATKIILYAPTFRGDWNHPDSHGANSSILDIRGCLEAASRRFGGEWRLFYRDHYAVKSGGTSESCVNVSDYPDMQELLVTSDILITDYSSSIWDYALTYKPGFLFTTDLEEYKADRDFVTSIDDWPYVVARSNEELIYAIENFDETRHKEKVRCHLESLGSFETGTASKVVGERIHSFCFGASEKEG